jgi:hypothetical protein
VPAVGNLDESLVLSVSQWRHQVDNDGAHLAGLQ